MEEIELSEEDDRALDAAWAKIDREAKRDTRPVTTTESPKPRTRLDDERRAKLMRKK